MVTVCLLNFSTTYSHTQTHTYIQSHAQKIKKSLPVRERNILIPLLFPCIVCDLHVSRHHHIDNHGDKSPPISTMTSVLFPADEGGTADGRLIERSSSLSSIISASLSSPFCPIYMLGGERKPFRSALTIKSPCGVLENWALTEKKGGGPQIAWLQLN